MLGQSDKDSLETLIDRDGLDKVVAALVEKRNNTWGNDGWGVS